MTSERHSTHHRGRKFLAVGFALAVLTLALTLLHHELRHYQFHELKQAVFATPPDYPLSNAFPKVPTRPSASVAQVRVVDLLCVAPVALRIGSANNNGAPSNASCTT